MFSRISDRKILAVDWDARSIRLVYAGVGRKAVRLDRMLSVDVPSDVDVSDPQALGRLIRDVLKQESIRTDRAILDVPRDQALLATLKLPAAALEEMPAMVEFQIAKEIPFPLSEAVVDFAMPAAATDGPVDVLVGTVRREVVEYYRRTCEAAGLKLERLGLRPYANKVAMNELFGAGLYSCCVMVDVGPRHMEIDVVAAGRLVFSRAASVSVPRPVAPGSDQLMADSSISTLEESDGSAIIQFPTSAADGAKASDVDRVVNALLVEVTRSIEAYRATALGTEIDMIVVAGGTGTEARLAERIGARFGTSVELYNPARQFGWSQERGRDARAFSAALGLVTGHATEGRLQFDFLHPKKPITAAERRLRRAPAAAAAAAVLIAGIVAVYSLGIAPKKRALAAVNAQQSRIAKSREALESAEELIAKAEEFESSQIVWADELNRICGMMPDNKEMVLGDLDMHHKGARITSEIVSINEKIATDAVARIDNFRLPGFDQQYFDAKARDLGVQDSGRRGSQQYPWSGAIEIVIVGKAGE